MVGGGYRSVTGYRLPCVDGWKVVGKLEVVPSSTAVVPVPGSIVSPPVVPVVGKAEGGGDCGPLPLGPLSRPPGNGGSCPLVVGRQFSLRE